MKMQQMGWLLKNFIITLKILTIWKRDFKTDGCFLEHATSAFPGYRFQIWILSFLSESRCVVSGLFFPFSIAIFNENVSLILSLAQDESFHKGAGKSSLPPFWILQPNGYSWVWLPVIFRHVYHHTFRGCLSLGLWTEPLRWLSWLKLRALLSCFLCSNHSGFITKEIKHWSPSLALDMTARTIYSPYKNPTLLKSLPQQRLLSSLKELCQ